MLPASTSSRSKRESKQGKQTGRTIEIQRLIGRSLRTVVDLKKLNCGQFIVDCDVIQADGGTRTTSVTGAFVAMSLAIKKLLKQGVLTENPIKDYLAAISCGIINTKIFMDLDYEERNSNADVDANFIFAKELGISEVQISGEGSTFSLKLMNEMIKLSTKSVENILIYKEEQ